MKNFNTSLKSLLLLLLTTVCVFSTHAQAKIYSCGFEDAVNMVEWTTVNEATSGNGWYIGTAAYRSGSKGLYVSNTNGTTAAYNNTAASVTMAYYTVTLQAGKEYAVSFDWRARGEAGTDELSVCLLNNPADVISSSASATYPAWHAANLKGTISNSLIWQAQSFSLIGTGQPQRIVFVWKNDGNSVGVNPAGGVDNFYIREVSELNYYCGFDDPVENARDRKSVV